MLTNKLKINDSKTECVLVTSPHHASKIDLDTVVVTVGDAHLELSNVVSNLGVVLDKHLTMDSQIKKVSRSAYFHLRRVSTIRSHLD